MKPISHIPVSTTVTLYLYASDDTPLGAVKVPLVMSPQDGFVIESAGFPTHVNGERVAAFSIDAPGHRREHRHMLPG